MLDVDEGNGILDGCSFGELNDLTGELRDEDGDGIYTDYFALSGSTYTKQKYKMTAMTGQQGSYEDTIYIRETTQISLKFTV